MLLCMYSQYSACTVSMVHVLHMYSQYSTIYMYCQYGTCTVSMVHVLHMYSLYMRLLWCKPNTCTGIHCYNTHYKGRYYEGKLDIQLLKSGLNCYGCMYALLRTYIVPIAIFIVLLSPAALLWVRGWDQEFQFTVNQKKARWARNPLLLHSSQETKGMTQLIGFPKVDIHVHLQAEVFLVVRIDHELCKIYLQKY